MTYTPWMAGAVAAAKRANAAAMSRAKAKYCKEYEAYRAEARACGYEVETFAEWLGANLCSQLGVVYQSAREEAEARVMDGRSYAEWNYNADLY